MSYRLQVAGSPELPADGSSAMALVEAVSAAAGLFAEGRRVAVVDVDSGHVLIDTGRPVTLAPAAWVERFAGLLAQLGGGTSEATIDLVARERQVHRGDDWPEFVALLEHELWCKPEPSLVVVDGDTDEAPPSHRVLHFDDAHDAGRWRDIAIYRDGGDVEVLGYEHRDDWATLCDWPLEALLEVEALMRTMSMPLRLGVREESSGLLVFDNERIDPVPEQDAFLAQCRSEWLERWVVFQRRFSTGATSLSTLQLRALASERYVDWHAWRPESVAFESPRHRPAGR